MQKSALQDKTFISFQIKMQLL